MIDYLNHLVRIINHFGLFETIETSTIKLSKVLKISQQSVSRILIEMEKQKLIKRTSSARGVTIDIDSEGIKSLKNTYNILSKHFKDLTFSGEIKNGLGEGKYHITLPGYKKQFTSVLNIDPFPGTLNLKVDQNVINAIKGISEPKIIKGFETDERTYGSLTCYKCTIENNTPGWLIFAERSTHPENIIEVISQIHIRKEFNKKTLSIRCDT